MSYPKPTNLGGSRIGYTEVDLAWDPVTAGDSLLLMHFDGSDHSTSFVDSSSFNRTISVSGGLDLTTTNPKFGTAAAHFNDPTGMQAFSIPYSSSIDLSTGDFTIEFFIQFDIGAARPFVFLQDNFTSIYTFHFTLTQSSADIICSDSTGATAIRFNGALPNDDNWHHIAFCRSGSDFYFFLDGVRVTTGVAPGPFAGALGQNGQPLVAANLDFGRMDELRISNTAKYTANFTPPTAPFPDTPFGSPPKYTVRRDGFDRGTTTTETFNDIDTFIGGTTYTYEVAAALSDGTPDGPYSDPFDVFFPVPNPDAGTNPNTFFDSVVFGSTFGLKLGFKEWVYYPTRPPNGEDLSTMIINRYKQQPGETRKRGVDFRDFMEDGEVITSVAVTGITPVSDTTPLTVTQVLIDPEGQKFAYEVSGGVDGVEYNVQFTVQMNTGQVSQPEVIFQIAVLVEDQFP